MARATIVRKSMHGVSLALLAALAVAVFLREEGRYVHAWVYKNAIEYNLATRSEARPYSTALIRSLPPEEQPSCTPHPPRYPDIILLMVESLSSYQSRLFCGIRDWTPHLDAIARAHVHCTDFYANGFTTEDGEIALLTGLLPIQAPAGWTNWGGNRFSGFHHPPQSLPRLLKGRGYRTEYLTSADLAFAETGAWARALGFDYVEGHDHPAYGGWKRYQFNAAPDEALYDRVMDRIEANSRRGGLFLFVKTASSHHPFADPESGAVSEAAVFAYVDRQLGRFYEGLRSAGYFRHGILVIVGDHRAMVPLKPGEIRRIDPLRAPAKVPLVVVGSGRGSLEGAYQQTDVFNSLRNLGAPARCTTSWLGDFLSVPPLAPVFVAHRRGDNRHLVSVFDGPKDYLVLLDGDDTRFIGGDPVDPAAARQVVGKINRERLARARDAGTGTR
jgi:hypothetical protein